MSQAILASRDDGVVVRIMARKELDLAVEWAAGEGWNPGLNDAEVFFQADPEGFMVAEREGELLGSISAVAYGQDYGFMGFYIVRPEYRGQGIGGLMAQTGLTRLAGRIIGLDGVVAQQESYKKAGAELAFQSFRYEAVGTGGEGGGGGGYSLPPQVVQLSTLDFEQVSAYDQTCFPAERDAFLKAWISQPGGVALGVTDDGRLKGYGVLRPCSQGHKVGPLFADGPQQAEDLFTALLAHAPQGGQVFLDAPRNNPQASELVKRHDLMPVFETARMYLNGQPQWHAGRVFGITTFELG